MTSVSFDKIIPYLDITDNVILTHYGDISLAYKVILPEVHTMGVEGYNNIHSALNQLLLQLPENVLIHRQDVYLEEAFDSSTIFDKNDFWDSSLRNHFKDRKYITQQSYLYITLLDGFGFKRSISNMKYFKRLPSTDSFNTKLDRFISSCNKAVGSLQDDLTIIALTKDELNALADNHFNGYGGNKIVSPQFKPDYQIGRKTFRVFGLDEDINQKDGDVDLAILNQGMSTDISQMYSSYFYPIGLGLNHEHVVNSFMFYDSQTAIKKELDTKAKQLNGSRFMGRANETNATSTLGFLNDVENQSMKMVRYHLNVTIFDTDEKKLDIKETDLLSRFSKMGMVPTEYNYLDYPFLYLANAPGCGGHLPSEYTFITYSQIAFIYNVLEGNSLKKNDKGIFYTNRSTNTPFLFDTFFEPYETKLIDNRNYLVVAPSGGGKSFSSKSRQLQQYNTGFDQVVINIGGDDKITRLINSITPGDALYIKYEEGQTLSLNPFYVEDVITNDKIEFLISFVWLLWGGTDEISSDYSSVLNKIILMYYNVSIDVTSADGVGFKLQDIDSNTLGIQSFYNFLKTERGRISKIFFEDKTMFNYNSLLLNLEKFATGNYKNLFPVGKPLFFEKRKFLEFELDNIKDHQFLFPLFSMLISDVTFNTMWDDKGVKDFFMDEAWLVLEKPGMALLLKYIYKTIRKFDGAVGIAVQQITDLGVNDIIENAILGNCAIKYLLNHKNVLDQIPRLKEKLSLSDNEVAMLLSIKNKVKTLGPNDNSRYTEQFIKMGGDYSVVVRNEVSPELAVIYDSEKKRLKKFNALYTSNNEDIEKAIVEYLK